MKRSRVGFFLAMVVAIMSLTLYFLGCGGGDSGGGGKTSQFVAVANTDNDSISVFKILDNGALVSLDNVVLAEGSHPTMVAVTPNEKFVYVVNSNAFQDSWGDNASISAYAYDSKTGTITEIEGSPFSNPLDNTGISGGTYINMAITPNGKFLYVTDQSQEFVHGFAIGSTGALTFIESVDMIDAHAIAMHPSGRFLLGGATDGWVWSWVINSDGTLTQESELEVGSGQYVSVAVNPNGRYMYGAGVNFGAAFSINTSTGELAVLGDGEISTSVDQPKGVVVTPNARYLYTANFKSGTVWGVYHS